MKVQLRQLCDKDAEYMLEWMHDDYVVHDLQTDFSKKTIDDCLVFIKNASIYSSSVHLAIVDEKDEYMGTVSLKNIKDDTAEFAIVVRTCAMGKGYSKYAMERIIDIGFNEKYLSSIYWCVSPDNNRAIRFYNKNGYRRISCNSLNVQGEYNEEQIQNYYWYHVTKDNEM